MTNCKKLLPNLGEDLFFREHFDFGTKIEKYETDFKERPFFREHHEFRTKFVLRPRISDNFFILSVKY